jgi:lysozyme family protein
MTLPITWSPTEPTFESALRFTRWSEGNLSDDPHDSGGRTKWGVTQASYDAWRFTRKQPFQPVDMMTVDEMKQIYKELYWDTGTCQPMPAKLAITHFDWCVNHGPWAAKQMLQALLGVRTDGAIGQKTLAAIAAQDIGELVAAYIQARRDWYHDRVEQKPDQGRFLDGWLNRCDNLAQYLG